MVKVSSGGVDTASPSLSPLLLRASALPSTLASGTGKIHKGPSSQNAEAPLAKFTQTTSELCLKIFISALNFPGTRSTKRQVIFLS
jgi:hypothetical protein